MTDSYAKRQAEAFAQAFSDGFEQGIRDATANPPRYSIHIDADGHVTVDVREGDDDFACAHCRRGVIIDDDTRREWLCAHCGAYETHMRWRRTVSRPWNWQW